MARRLLAALTLAALAVLTSATGVAAGTHPNPCTSGTITFRSCTVDVDGVVTSRTA